MIFDPIQRVIFVNIFIAKMNHTPNEIELPSLSQSDNLSALESKLDDIKQEIKDYEEIQEKTRLNFQTLDLFTTMGLPVISFWVATLLVAPILGAIFLPFLGPFAPLVAAPLAILVGAIAAVAAIGVAQIFGKLLDRIFFTKSSAYLERDNSINTLNNEMDDLGKRICQLKGRVPSNSIADPGLIPVSEERKKFGLR